MADTLNDVVIVGAGPAGLTAALYAGRFRLKTKLIERLSAGGQIILSVSIENYPGFASIATVDLIERMLLQIDALGISVQQDEIIGIQEDNGIYILQGRQDSYPTKTVILASGASSRRLGVKGEEELTGRGVSYCATCDGALFKDKVVVVVGGGDRALEEAIFLARYARLVYLVHRRQQFRASAVLVEKAEKIPQISFIYASVVEEIIGTNRVEAVRIRSAGEEESRVIPCDGVFIFVGIQPNTAWLGDFVLRNEQGFIITDEKMMTNRAGVFACGDCRHKTLYQVITACAEAATASYSAHLYLLSAK